jgi:hypothetical protein
MMNYFLLFTCVIWSWAILRVVCLTDQEEK